MENDTQNFHCFSRLPMELGLAIWRECLPNRVVEIDYPWDSGGVFGPDPPPCKLQQKTGLNRRAPIISRACRESRLVAFEAGHFREEGSTLEPEEVLWKSNIRVDKTWIDPSRDTIHLNWTPAYSAGYWGDGSALDYLAWSAAKARGGSFMFDYLDNLRDSDVSIEERIGALRKLQHGVIVMRVIVVRTIFENAEKTGLFGLLGDAYFQLVHVSDETRVNPFLILQRNANLNPADTLLGSKTSAGSLRSRSRNSSTTASHMHLIPKLLGRCLCVRPSCSDSAPTGATIPLEVFGGLKMSPMNAATG